MILEVRAVAPFYKNGFVVGCERTGDGIMIDPGDEADELVDAASRHSLTVKYILLTHAHVDHITGVGLAKSACHAPVYLHKDDLPFYERAVQQGQMFGLVVQQPPPVDMFYDRSPIPFGDYSVHIHHTPGHCPGGVCLEVLRQNKTEQERRQGPAHLFVGDTLFAGSIGRTDLPGGNYALLMRSITDVLFPLGEDAIVHPGHGPDTTIGRERKTNPFVVDYLASKNV
jgi:hydroxyacylglutathione hydrolase